MINALLPNTLLMDETQPISIHDNRLLAMLHFIDIYVIFRKYQLIHHINTGMEYSIEDFKCKVHDHSVAWGILKGNDERYHFQYFMNSLMITEKNMNWYVANYYFFTKELKLDFIFLEKNDADGEFMYCYFDPILGQQGIQKFLSSNEFVEKFNKL